MKFIAKIDDTGKVTSFIYNEPGPVPPIVEPENPDEPKDAPDDQETGTPVLVGPVGRKKARPPFSQN
jgi:hypothetical protein